MKHSEMTEPLTHPGESEVRMMPGAATGGRSSSSSPYVDAPTPSETRGTDNWGLTALHERMSLRGALTKRILQLRALNRLLLLALFSVVLYLVLGGVFCMVMMDYNFTNTIYFLVTSMLTIGYGDYAPDDGGEKVIVAFLLLFAVGGIGVWVGFAINIFFRQGDRGVEKRLAQYRQELYREGLVPSPIHEFGLRKKAAKLQLRFAVTMWVCLSFFGMLIFVMLEDDSWANGFYWVINTCTTTGYGNVTPTKDSTKWFTVFFAVVTSMVLLWTLGLLGTYPLRVHQWELDMEVLSQYGEEITEEEFEQIVTHTATSLAPLNLSSTGAFTKFMSAEATARARLNRPDLGGRAPAASGGRSGVSVSRADFVLTMLLMLDRVSEQDLRECGVAFDKLDKNGEGVLYREDFARPRGRQAGHHA